MNNNPPFLQFFLLVIVLFYSSVSCVGNVLPSGFPIQSIPSENINTYLKIYTPIGWNDFRVGSPIAIEIINISDETISATLDFSIQCFTYSDSKWNLLPKVPVERNEGYLIMRPSIDIPQDALASVIFPIIKNADVPIDLRVLVTGNIFRDGKPTDMRVGAFTDVTLYPSTDN